ncbi:WYL domain-containing protein [Stutzerimonas stutzeri]
MSAEYPEFKAPMLGLAILAVPFLWYFDWAGWAWIVVGLVYALAISGWYAEVRKIYLANKAGDSSLGTARDQANKPFEHNDDEYIQGETIWTGAKQIRFNYRNSKGEYSDREVTVHKVVAGDEDTYFVGLCHMRNEPRTFRLDRVSPRNKVTDTATGEINTLRRVLGVKRRARS